LVDDLEVQADRFVGLGVKLGGNVEAIAPAEFTEHFLGKLAVLGAVEHDPRLWPSTAQRGQAHQGPEQGLPQAEAGHGGSSADLSASGCVGGEMIVSGARATVKPVVPPVVR